MNDFKIGDRVICYPYCLGKITKLLEATEDPQNQLYEVHFGCAGNFRLRDSELVKEKRQ